MAQDLTIPAATSVVDYLNSQEQDSSYSARGKLYATAGIDKRLGSFAGTASQNTALLDYLKTTNAPPSAGSTPAPATSAVESFGSMKTTTPATMAPATSTFNFANTPGVATPPNFKAVSIAPPPTAAPFDFSKVPGVTAPAGASLNLAPPAAPAPTAAATVAAAQTPPAPAATPPAPVAPTQTTSYGAAVIPASAAPSESDLITQFLSSAAGQSLQDKVQNGELSDTAASAEAKRLLEVKYKSEATTLENSLAAHGLAFSGIRNTQIKALADNLAASELNVDQQLASKLLDSNSTLRDGIIKGVADLVAAADAKDKTAIAQLNAVGLAVVNGQLVPTLASRNADRAAAQQQIANDRAQANFELSQKRLDLAQQSADRAEKRFEAMYGASGTNFFRSVQSLIKSAPDATEQDIRLAIDSNPNIFGKPSVSQITDALSLVGIPDARQDNIATQAIAASFKGPGFFDSLIGNKSAKEDAALATAKKAAKQTILDSKGIIEYTDPSGSVTKYKLNSDQLQGLIDRVDTITLDEVNAAK